MNEQYLWKKLGPFIQKGLEDNQVVEVCVNPDQKIWFTHQKRGNICVGALSITESSAIVHAIAQYEEKYINDKTPDLDATLPFNGERINITIPPITESPSFSIRKRPKIIYTLDQYVESSIITQKQADMLTDMIRQRKNILVSGSPGSGKTTFANALIDVISNVEDEGHRVLVLEDTHEIQCKVSNVKHMLCSKHISMNRLLWIAMRNSPDRIIVGEVRDGAALDMLKSWNTGCPGGIATTHANNPQAAIQRVLDLACESITTPPYSLAAEALDVIVQIDKDTSIKAGRRVTGICDVEGFDRNTQTFLFKELL